jgi:hypothetical protein
MFVLKLCSKVFLGVGNTKERWDLSISLVLLSFFNFIPIRNAAFEQLDDEGEEGGEAKIVAAYDCTFFPIMTQPVVVK